MTATSSERSTTSVERRVEDDEPSVVLGRLRSIASQNWFKVVVFLAIASVVAFLVLDFSLRWYLEEIAEDEIDNAMPGSSGVEVTIHGFPIVYDIFGKGRIDGITVRIAHVKGSRYAFDYGSMAHKRTASDIQLEVRDLEIHADSIYLDVAESWPSLTSSPRVEDLGKTTIEGYLTQEALTAGVEHEVEVTPRAIYAIVDGQRYELAMHIEERRRVSRVFGNKDLRELVFRGPIPGVLVGTFPLPTKEVLPCRIEHELTDGKVRLHCAFPGITPSMQAVMAAERGRLEQPSGETDG